jgi:DNA-binding NarL/FixJ family response regulator
MHRKTLIVPYRTLVVEDHRPFLDHICAALREHADLQVVGETQNGLEAVEYARDLQPDLILLDIGLPGLNGIEAARRIRSIAPNAKIVFVTQESSDDLVHAAFELGAWGYVLKTSVARDLSAAVDAVINGKKFVSEGLLASETLLNPRLENSL